MTDIPWTLTSADQLMLRIGTASYPNAATRATALALGMLATPADLAGFTATIAADVQTINMTANVDRRVPFTVGETLAGLQTLRDMEMLHETARLVGSTRVHLIDCRGLVSRADPVLDCIGPDLATQVESDTYRFDDREAA